MDLNKVTSPLSIYLWEILKEADTLVIASPICYHGLTGQLKCIIEQFYVEA